MARKLAAFGFFHTLRIDSRGKLWAHGHNREGQCGAGSYVDVPEPVQVRLPSRARVTSMALMMDYSVVVCGEQLLASGGGGGNGYFAYQLPKLSTSASFSVVETPGSVVRWVRCAHYAVVIGIDDEVYALGRIRGICETSREWVRLDALCGRAIDTLTVGSDVIIFHDAERGWWGYGGNMFNTLALGSVGHVADPVHLAAFDAAHIVHARVSDRWTVAVCADGYLYVVNSSKRVDSGWCHRTDEHSTLLRVLIPRDSAGVGGEDPGEQPLRVVDFSMVRYHLVVVGHDRRLWEFKFSCGYHRRIPHICDCCADAAFPCAARAHVTAAVHMNGRVLFATDTGAAYTLSYATRMTAHTPLRGEYTRAPQFDGLLCSSLPPRTPRSLIDLAAHRVRLADIEAAAARGRTGEAALVPPHILRYVQRIARAVRGGGGGGGGGD